MEGTMEGTSRSAQPVMEPDGSHTQFQIIGADSQVLQIQLPPGASCVAEPGSFVYSSASVSMDVGVGEGGLAAGICRLFTGEALLVSTFTNTARDGADGGFVGFAPAAPSSKIVPLDVRGGARAFVCRAEAFVAAVGRVSVAPRLASVELGLLGSGDALALHRVSGDGVAFVHGAGALVERALGEGERLIVDAGCVVAFDERVRCELEFVGSLRLALFGGRGLFHARLTGPGACYVQSLPLPRFAARARHAAARAALISVWRARWMGAPSSRARLPYRAVPVRAPRAQVLAAGSRRAAARCRGARRSAPRRASRPPPRRWRTRHSPRSP